QVRVATPLPVATRLFLEYFRDVLRRPSSTSDESEAQARPNPRTPRRAGRIKSCLLNRELAVDRWERACDVRAAVGESRRAKLRGSVVTLIEKIVDLPDQLQPACQIIPAAETDNAVGGRCSRPQVVSSVRLVPIVLVAARE